MYGGLGIRQVRSLARLDISCEQLGHTLADLVCLVQTTGTSYESYSTAWPATPGPFVTFAKEVMFSSLFVCLSVCLSVSNFAQKRPNGFLEIFRETWQ